MPSKPKPKSETGSPLADKEQSLEIPAERLQPASFENKPTTSEYDAKPAIAGNTTALPVPAPADAESPTDAGVPKISGILRKYRLRHLRSAARRAGIAVWDYNAESNQCCFSQGVIRILELPEAVLHRTSSPWFFLRMVSNRESRRELVSSIRVTLRKGLDTDLTIPVTTVDGRRRWIRVVAERDDPSCAGVVAGMLQDVTHWSLQQMEMEKLVLDLESARSAQEEHSRRLSELLEEFQIQKTRAEEANSAKSRFLATMSHEIRTPLNGVLGMASLLLASALTADQREITETLLRSAESLMEIISDILDFSRIEAGKVQLEYIPFDLHQLLEDLIVTSAPLAQQKNLDIVLFFDAALPQKTWGDPIRLRQIVQNFVGNAIKFTPSGYVSIRAMLAETDSGGCRGDACNLQKRVRIAVTDTGIGIAANQIDRLFEPFEQADGSTTRRFGGSGLGLSICKELCKLMGGSIRVRSSPGQGSTFSVELPFPAQEGVEPSVLPIRLRGATITIVAGTLLRESLQELATAVGMRTNAYPDLFSALTALSEGPTPENYGRPTAVLIFDADMTSSRNLMQVDSDLDRFSQRPGAHVIALTKTGSARNIPQLRQLHWLSKPVRRSAFYSLLDELLRRNENVRGLANLAAALRVAKNDVNRPCSNIRILLVEDNIVNQRVAERLLASFGCQVTIAPNGVAGIRAAQHQSFDLVLMDCQMPEVDGFECTRRIREDLRLKTPVVALTASATPDEMDRCLRGGMNDFLSKPIRMEELRVMVSKWTTLTAAPEPR